MAIEISDLKKKLERIAEAHGVKGYVGLASLLDCTADTPRDWVRDSGDGPNHVPADRIPELVALIVAGAERGLTDSAAEALLKGDYLHLHLAFDEAADSKWEDLLTREASPDHLQLEYGPSKQLGVTELSVKFPPDPSAQEVELDTYYMFRLKAPSSDGEVALLKYYNREWTTIVLGENEKVTLASSGDKWAIPGTYENDQLYFNETREDGPALFLAIGVRGRFQDEVRALLQEHKTLLPPQREELAERLKRLPAGAIRLGYSLVYFVPGDL